MTGSVICNMAQSYVHRIQKQAPPIIIRALERGVAAEARRIKEQLFIEYLDKMNLLESDLPCDEEQLYTEHIQASKSLLQQFDNQLKAYFEYEDVQDERGSFIDRMDAFFTDLRENNYNMSMDRSKDSFHQIFNPLKEQGFKISSSDQLNVGDIEKNLLTCIQKYKDLASGPCADNVFAEEISFVIPYLCSIMRDQQSLYYNTTEDLERENKAVTRQRDDSRNECNRIRKQLDETKERFEKMLEQRDNQINELQAGVNMRIHMAETRVREQAREIQGLNLELQQAQKERELMIEAEREIYEKRLADADGKFNKLQIENNRYEKQLDDLREEQERIVNEKNETINELSRRLKLMENQTEAPSPRQDSTLLKSLKSYLDDILTKFSKEQTANQKYLAQLERVSSLQSELNQLRTREQESRNKLIEEYEEKIHKLKLEKDNLNKQYSELLQKEEENLRATYESVAGDIEKCHKLNAEREEQIKRLMEEKGEMSSELARREQQLADQYEVLERHKARIEELQCDIDDKIMEISKLKVEIAEINDDNDSLCNLVKGVLEFVNKRRANVSQQMARIHNDNNKTEVAAILRTFRVPF